MNLPNIGTRVCVPLHNGPLVVVGYGMVRDPHSGEDLETVILYRDQTTGTAREDFYAYLSVHPAQVLPWAE